jgi:hypothetical protein
MNKTNLEAFKMSKVQMNAISGGNADIEEDKRRACAAVQYKAQYYIEHGASNEIWDAWADEFERFC